MAPPLTTPPPNSELPFVYDPVRISAEPHGRDILERFLSVWEEQGCEMKELSCAQHDAYAASSQFVTHLGGRVGGEEGGWGAN